MTTNKYVWQTVMDGDCRPEHIDVGPYQAWLAAGRAETARIFIENIAQHGQPMNRKQRRKAAREAKR